MTFLTVVFVLGPYCADQGGVVFLLTESSMLYHHLLNPLCAFVSFVLLEREPKLPARCVPLALVPTMLYGSVALWANYQRLITGPYPFLLVYQQTTRQTVLWCAAILAMNLLYAWLCLAAGRELPQKEKCGLAFQELRCKRLSAGFGREPFLVFCLQQGDPGLCAGRAGGFVPDACLYFADVGAAQQQHAQTALADAAADGVGQLTVQHCLVERQGAAVVTACHGQLPVHAFGADADAHAAQLVAALQGLVPEQQVAVQVPVVVVGARPSWGLPLFRGAPIFIRKVVPFSFTKAFSRSFGVRSGYLSSSSWVVIKVTLGV